MIASHRPDEAAAVAGEPARAAILAELADGRARTAGELARDARISRATALAHLAPLAVAGLVSVVRQGRHGYYRLASPEAARRVDGLLRCAAAPGRPPRRAFAPGPRDPALRSARTCHDHVAGRLGVAIADRLVADGVVELRGDRGSVTTAGHEVLARAGIAEVLDTGRLARSRRPLCRPCLDWSERRPHLAGRIGAAILECWLARGWLRRPAGGRTLAVTPAGRIGLRDALGLRWGG